VIDLLKEHWSEVAALIVFTVSLGKIWGKLTSRIDSLTEQVKLNRAHIDEKLTEVSNRFFCSLDECQGEREQCRKQIREHHENTLLHLTPSERELQSEWRAEVFKRFDKLERLILNGSGRRGT
jgi:hypothetical protein